MPKGKRKGKSDRGRNEGSSQTSDDDSYNNDAASVMSNYSEGSPADDPEEVDEVAQEQFEEKLMEVLDGLTQKSSQGRTTSLQSLSKALVKKYIPSFVKERHFTICDSVERSLKKGGSAEKGAAADLIPLICVQLGLDDTTEEVCRLLKPILISTALDNTAAASVRAKCCLAVGTISFLSGGDIGEVMGLMQQLESIFSGSYLKGDRSVPNISPEIGNLHASAVSAWSLLFTLMTPGSLSTMLNNKTFPTLERLSELFTSSHLEVRLSAGEALAVIFELGREENDDFAEDTALEILDTLKQLATDSHKYRAKKDRKQQRATFRDILLFIEEDVISDVKVKFGREVLVLDTWVKRKQYDALCANLGPGINLHLAENDLLREIFEITAPPIAPGTVYQQQQMERNYKRILNAANFKARTISRAKNRDKRSDF